MSLTRFTGKQIICLATTVCLIVSTLAYPAYALDNPQDPATEAIIKIKADGLAPFDATTGPAVAGTDDVDNNGIVRNVDTVVYQVEVTVNDANDTNVLATVTLNNKASWTGVPAPCRTVADGFVVAPDSSIADTTGDGLKDTLICNLGEHNEGTKILFDAAAIASGNNLDVIEASVMSSSDNNVNTSGLAGTQGDGPVLVAITANFGINLSKAVGARPPANKDTYKPRHFEPDQAAPGSPEGEVIHWRINLNYDTGSEHVASAGGVQDFTISDTWVGTHSNDTTVDSDNATGYPNDQIVTFGTITGVPADSCALVGAPVGSVTCTQAGPGEPITIQVDGVAVNQSPIAAIDLYTFVPASSVFEPNGYAAAETYNVDNTVTLTGWNGPGTMVTSETGVVDPGPETATDDWLLSRVLPGNLSFIKTFDGVGAQKSGQRAAARGEVVETSLVIQSKLSIDSTNGICDTLDTDSFEFVGYTGAGQKDGAEHGEPQSASFWPYPYHEKFNPSLYVYDTTALPTFYSSYLEAEATAHGATIEFSDVSYATTGDNHWTATCEDDLDGDSNNDWTTDYTSFAGGAADVVRVRMIWVRSEADMIAAAGGHDWNAEWLQFSFDIKIKESLPNSAVGTQLPNTAATFWDQYSDRGWLSTIDGGGQGAWGANWPYTDVEDDPTSPLYSFNAAIADRVEVLGESMSITKTNDPVDRGSLTGGDTARFTIDPNTVGGFATPATMTFTDTLPAELAYVSDTCAADYAGAELTCTASVSGQTITYTVADYTVGEGDLPPFTLETTVRPGTPSGTYVNNVQISSDFIGLTNDEHCLDATDTQGNPAVAACQAAFVAPHSDSASVFVISQNGYEVSKRISDSVVEPNSNFVTTLTYQSLGGASVGAGQIIDILPYNGDGAGPGTSPYNYSPARHNSLIPNPNTSTFSSDPDGAADFVSVTPSAAGETFEYTTDAPSTVDHRPCHPDNWPAGTVVTPGGANAVDSMCERGLIDPATDVPTLGQAGTGATTWGALPADPSDVSAFRATTPLLMGASAPRDMVLTLNSAHAHEEDLFCNNFGSNSSLITLDIVSNDVCIPVVAGTIGDYVWHDENGDTIQTGEDPIPNVKLKLLVEDPTGPGTYIPFQIPDPANPGSLMDYVATTDQNGLYLFENLPSGNFRVMVDETTLPPRVVQTFDNSGPLDNMSDLMLFGPNNPETPGQSYTDVTDDLDQDFGYQLPVDMALTNQTTSTVVDPGENVTFTVELTNQGGVATQDILIAYCIPIGFTLTDATGWFSDAALTIPASAGDAGTVYGIVPGPIAANGATATTTIDLTVAAGAQQADLITIAEIVSYKNTNGVDITTRDIDSVGNDIKTDDAGGTVGTPEDNHIDDDGLDTDGDDITDEDDHDPAQVTLNTFDLALIKQLATDTDTTNFRPGDSVTFTVTVINQGEVDASEIGLVDYLPAGLTLADTDWTLLPDGSATLNTPIPALAAGQQTTVDITVTVNADAEGVIINFAEISAALTGTGNPVIDVDSTPDTDPNDTYVTDDDVTSANGDEDDHDPAQITINSFDLALIKRLADGTDASNIQPGDAVTFTVTVINQGGVDASQVALVDYLPAGLTLADTDWTLQPDGSATLNTPIPALAAGQQTTVDITVTVNADATGDIINFAEIAAALTGTGDPAVDIDSTPDTEPNDTYITDDDVTSANGDEDDHDPAQITVGAFDLALIKRLAGGTDAANIEPGDAVTFTMTVINQGGVDASEIGLVDYLPAGLTLADTDWTLQPNGSATLNTPIPTLAAGQQTTVDITVTVNADAKGDIINFAEISAALTGTGDPAVDIDSTPDTEPNDTYITDDDVTSANGDEDDHDPAQITVKPFDLALVKRLSEDTDTSNVKPGDAVTFTLTVINQGEVDASHVELVDYLPAGLTLADRDWTLQPDGSATLNTPIPTLAAGQQTTVNITVTVDADAQAEIDNYAEISAALTASGNPVVDIDSIPDNSQTDTLISDDDVTSKDGDEDDHDIAKLTINQPKVAPLAFTGNNTRNLTALALIALFAGLAATSVTRRRKTQAV